MSAWAKPLKVEPELPKVLVEKVRFRNGANMNNLPATVTINGVVWTRTASASDTGTYSYGSNGGTSSDIATNPHFTVSPVSVSSSAIYNIHYTVPGSGGVTRYYYYPDAPVKDRFQVMPMPDEIFRRLKLMVDRLLFVWSWAYLPGSAHGPATPDQVQ